MRSKIVHIVPEWPSYSQTFVRDDIEISMLIFDTVKVFPLPFREKSISAVHRDLFRLVMSIFLLLNLLQLKEFRYESRKQFVKSQGLHLNMIGIYKIVTAAIFIRKFDLHNLSSQTIIHAHFLSTGTDVAILIKCAFPKLVIVATGHGSDVLFQSEEKAINLYSNLDQIYMASQAVMDKFIHNCASTEDHQSPDLILRYCRIPDNHNLPKTNFMKFENSKLEILTVARFHPQKGLDIAIQCAHLLKLRKVDFNWNFIGDGDLRQTLEAQVASYDLKNHVTFLGVRTREYVQECMRKSDIFSLTSVKSKGASDGLPVAILEAMDLGAYVITTDVGGISEAINAKRGSLIEPNAKALFAEIQKVNARGKENREYTVRARQWVTQNCKRSEMDPLLIGYRELLRLK